MSWTSISIALLVAVVVVGGVTYWLVNHFEQQRLQELRENQRSRQTAPAESRPEGQPFELGDSYFQDQPDRSPENDNSNGDGTSSAVGSRLELPAKVLTPTSSVDATDSGDGNIAPPREIAAEDETAAGQTKWDQSAKDDDFFNALDQQLPKSTRQ